MKGRRKLEPWLKVRNSILANYLQPLLHTILQEGVSSRHDLYLKACLHLGTKLPFSTFQNLMKMLPEIDDLFRRPHRFTLPMGRHPDIPGQTYLPFMKPLDADLDQRVPPDMQLPRIIAHDTPTIPVLGGGPPAGASGPTRPTTDLMSSPFLSQ